MKTWVKWAIGIAVVAVLAFYFLRAPDYPDTIIPKPPRGNASSSVVIEDFSDFQCPACGAAHPVVKRIIEEYGDRVQLQYRQFPLSSIHPRAFLAAEASECANDQGKFWEYHDLLFENQDRLDRADLRRYAEELGLDMEKFNACLASGKKAKIVTGEQRQGTARNVQGTPTFFINGKQLRSWNYESFKAEIEEELTTS